MTQIILSNFFTVGEDVTTVGDVPVDVVGDVTSVGDVPESLLSTSTAGSGS